MVALRNEQGERKERAKNMEMEKGNNRRKIALERMRSDRKEKERSHLTGWSSHTAPRKGFLKEPHGI